MPYYLYGHFFMNNVNNKIFIYSISILRLKTLYALIA
nr:MAG TPA: hypothetical protein [Caudoviricetes sp.]